VTSDGDIHDYTLAAGESYIARDSIVLVIEAMREAVINLKDMDEEFAAHVVA